ncbi:hypothetical protein N1851_034600 [Merluccius polli]|uniref:Uncharacterized protein n=1 Tax=Merluccius polli TaxID=89951 RepID=A0AA47LZA4_MERPO|nr:hypothetical protein N1851_034600 [Merluccius polli]
MVDLQAEMVAPAEHAAVVVRAEEGEEEKSAGPRPLKRKMGSLLQKDKNATGPVITRDERAEEEMAAYLREPVTHGDEAQPKPTQKDFHSCRGT